MPTVRRNTSASSKRAPRRIPPAARPIPVTLLSGFLGSGKTSLMKHILENREGLRVAVIVNEISEVNIDALSLEGAKLLKTEEKLVEMANGCICCTLREDLLLQLRELARSGDFDAVLIESSGIAEPMQVAETFFVNTNDGNVELQLEAPLDNCVTVIDASMVRHYMDSFDAVTAIDAKADTSGESSDADIAGLLFSQLEFANVVLLNKADLVAKAAANGSDASSPLTREALEAHPVIAELVAMVNRINPHVTAVVPTVHAKIDLGLILRTKFFSNEFAMKTANWIEDIKSGIKHVPETLEYGVSSFYFTSDRPFHPQRLHDWMDRYFLLKQLIMEDVEEEEGEEEEVDEDDEDDDDAEVDVQGEAEQGSQRPVRVLAEGEELEEQVRRRQRYGNLFRGKGFAWIGGLERSKHIASWSQAGPILTLEPAGFIDPRSKERPGQQLVFIGQNLKHDTLRADIEELLLTDEEVEAFNADAAKGIDGTFPDPFHPFPSLRDVRETLKDRERGRGGDKKKDRNTSRGGKGAKAGEAAQPSGSPTGSVAAAVADVDGEWEDVDEDAPQKKKGRKPRNSANSTSAA